MSQLASHRALVLRAPTGAGKTTRVPLAWLQCGLAGTGKILMLEPRRLAARAAAARMSQELGRPLGQDVGYQVRFDSRQSSKTRILVVTEGILLRQLQSDPFLDGIDTVIFDEFHERNLTSDLTLGMVRRIQQTVRTDLKIIVMSATLEPAPIAEYLGQAALIESQGRSYPVQIEYLKQRDRRDLVELAAWGVQHLFPQTTGHLLAFLPGVGEIHRTMRELEDFSRRQQAALLPLYGDLPSDVQDSVLAASEQRKIVLATNVAETSITIPGVTAVVDTGVARIQRFDPSSGLDRLELEPISQASADQRAGRAGRTQSGRCLRLWEEASQRIRPPQTEPEIRRVDLTGPVLQLKNWGERDVLAFPWFEAPRSEAVEQATLLLQRLGACDANGQVTALGAQMAQFPVHPRIARMLLAGHQRGESRRTAWLSALLEERDPFFRPRPGSQSSRGLLTVQMHHSESDVLDRLSALEEAERAGTREFPWGTLNLGAARQIARARDQLLQLLRDVQSKNSPTEDVLPEIHASSEVLLKALVAAFPDRVARRRSPGSDKGLMVGGRGVKLAPQSSVRTGDLFLCVQVDAGQSDAFVRQASLVKAEWLPESSVNTQTDLFFHPTHKQVQARKREYFADLILSETPAPVVDQEGAAQLLYREAASAWNQIFPVEDPVVRGYLERVRCLSKWMPELELPELDEHQQQQILQELCRHCRSFAELKKADWIHELSSLLSWPQRQAIEKEAPASWTVPSGSQIRLEYEQGRPPVLSVRIQEVFGMRETPRIAAGRIKILLHLLAPNRQPQQVTEDLASFWRNTYPGVRKEMARRYPRHPWPEDPLTAKAIRK